MTARAVPPSLARALRPSDGRAFKSSRQTRFVQRQQLSPRAFSVRLVVNRLSVRLLGHVRNAPPVLRLRIHLDLRRYLCGIERFFELRLRVRLLRVVVRGDAEIHPRFDLRGEQMWAARVWRHQTAAVERCSSADAV